LDYQQALRELTRRREVPSIDMNALIAERLNVTLPDYSCFVDNCHFKLILYQELTREILRILRKHDVAKLNLPQADAAIEKEDIEKEDIEKYLGLTPELVTLSHNAAHFTVADESGEKYLRLPRIEQALRYFRQLQNGSYSLLVTREIDNVTEVVEEMRDAERTRLLQWIRQDNDLFEQ
jgi:hypothetical protein